MSDQISINVISDQNVNISVDENDDIVLLNPITLNEGLINHSITHQNGGSDELRHNSLGGLDGGTSNQFYHLSSGQYFNLTTGDVVRPSETGAFYPASNPSGFLTGVDLSSYATISYASGISGSLQNQISDLNNQTGSYILNSQTGQFYSSANPNGYTSTSYVTGISGNLQNQITVLNNQTGSFYPRTNPSGYITGVDLSFSGNYYTKTESESRYVNITGAETILGDKTFHDRVYINNLYVTGLETIVNTTNTNVASNYLMLNLTGGAVDGGIFFVTGSGLTGINDSGAIIGFDHSDKFKFGVGTRASDLSVLNTIASFSDITGASGNLQTQISTLNSATGSYVLNSQTGNFITQNQTGQFYPSSNPSGFITGVDLSPYVTGDVVRPSQTGAFYPASNPSGFLTGISNIVYTTGDQSIAGNKTFSNNIVANGTSNRLPNQIISTDDSIVTRKGLRSLIGYQSIDLLRSTWATQASAGSIGLSQNVYGLLISAGSTTNSGQITVTARNPANGGPEPFLGNVIPSSFNGISFASPIVINLSVRNGGAGWSPTGQAGAIAIGAWDTSPSADITSLYSSGNSNASRGYITLLLRSGNTYLVTQRGNSPIVTSSILDTYPSGVFKKDYSILIENSSGYLYNGSTLLGTVSGAPNGAVNGTLGIYANCSSFGSVSSTQARFYINNLNATWE